MSNDYYKAAKKVWFDFFYRQQLIELYGWSIPGDEAIDAIENLPGNYILEVGAGGGYWASLIKKKKVVCTDNFSWTRPSKQWHEIEELNAYDAADKYNDADILMMVWPPMYTEWPNEIAKKFKTVIYVGERRGGCTADIDIGAPKRIIEIPRWSGVRDWVFIYER